MGYHLWARGYLVFVLIPGRDIKWPPIAMNNTPQLVALFTDFGVGSHYLGQVKARLVAGRVSQPVIDLCSDAPNFNPRAAAYLLASFLPSMPKRTLFVAVVDPGVGGDRRAILVRSERFWFVGPDNGLLSQVVSRSGGVRIQTIDLPDLPNRSRTFDGRDYFAPAAALICNGAPVAGESVTPASLVGADWPPQLPEIIYLDGYGNGVTGLSGESLSQALILTVNGASVPYAETFSAVPPGSPFWYVNANGLVEVAVNQGSAVDRFGLDIGVPVQWSEA